MSIDRIEKEVFEIQKELNKIMDESGFEYIITWDEEGELGLWNYDFAVIGEYKEIEILSYELEIKNVSTYVDTNDDEYDYTICCYIDLRDKL